MMESQLTVRLPQDLTHKIKERAKRLKLKRSDVVRLALREFLEGSEDFAGTPYERAKHLIGSIQTGIPDMGAKHREYLIEKFRNRRG